MKYPSITLIRKLLKASLPVVLSMLLFLSCMDDNHWSASENYNEPEQGVFIVNEGNFMYDNASLSYYSPNNLTVLNEVFKSANGAPLGDVAQSMVIRDSLGYVVINNSGKVYIININTFEFVGKITGLTSPRHMHFISDSKAYISDIYGKSIAIVNPVAMSVTGQIDVDNHSGEFYQHSTEQMVLYQKFMFVNCWSYDDKLLVIDTQTDQVVDSIEVGIQPRAMVMDRNDQLWVITDGGFQGNPFDHEAPALVQIDADTRTIVQRILFDLASSPADIAINTSGDTLYFVNGDVFRCSIDNPQSMEIFIETPYQGSYSRGFSALGIDPHSNEIYVADAIDNSQRGSVYKYSPRGRATDTFKVGIIPTHFCFKR
jgi:YVTN family beta-propeller protein